MNSHLVRWKHFFLLSKFYYLFEEYIDAIHDGGVYDSRNITNKMQSMLDARNELDSFLYKIQDKFQEDQILVPVESN